MLLLKSQGKTLCVLELDLTRTQVGQVVSLVMSLVMSLVEFLAAASSGEQMVRLARPRMVTATNMAAAESGR